MSASPGLPELPKLPKQMLHLDCDSRGFPVPFIILRDRKGKPYFAANDPDLVAKANKNRLCHICGLALNQDQDQDQDPGAWFVGGPGSYYLNGDVAAYNDGPLHHACMTYAMQVCPYLAQRMGPPVAGKLQGHLRKKGIETYNPTIIPGDPGIFIAIESRAWELKNGPGPMPVYVIQRALISQVEYWMAAKQLPPEDGEVLARTIARVLARRLVKS